MAPSTALCFVLLALAAQRSGGAQRAAGRGSPAPAALSRGLGYAAELLALVACLIGGLSLIAYPTGALYLRQLPGSISMAAHTAAAFVVLGAGVLCAADGAAVRALRLARTERVLLLGFGVLTGLLVTVGLVFTVNLQTLAQDIDAQANVARPRREATFELENRVLGYALAVRLARDGDSEGRRAATTEADGLQRHLAEYRALAATDRQRALAARFAAQWRAVQTLGTALLAGHGPLSPEESTHLATLRGRLMDLLEQELRAEAVAAFEVRRATTLRDLSTANRLPLLLLVVTVLLALLTSGATARAVSNKERTVRQQREWLRVTLSSIGDGVIACDTERRVIFLNPVAEALTGWPASEAHGQPLTTVLRLIDESTGEPAADIAERVLRERRVLELANHTALVTRDGRALPIEDSAAPIGDTAGTVTGVVLVFHDVTQRRRALVQLEESEARLGRAQAMAHLGSWELDRVENRLTWSDEVYRIFGLRPQQFGATYEAFLAAIHPDDRAAVDAAYTGSLRDGRDAYELEHRVVRASGEIRTVHEKCLHVRDAAGHVVRSLGMVHDITERTRAEEALRRSEEKFAKAFHGSASAMAITRLHDGLFVDVNERYLEVTRSTRDEIVGKASPQLQIWKHPAQRERFVDALRQHGRVRNQEFSFVRHGEEWTGLVFSQVSELGGEPVIISSIVDISERKRAEAALAAANLRLAEADLRKNEFLAVLSHELRNPLTPVRNSLFVLERAAPGGAQARRAVEVIDRQTKQLARLVDDLLEVTRVTRNKIQLQRGPLEFSDLVHRSVEDYRFQFEERGIALETELAQEPLPIDGDAARLTQVVGNLLHNAAKFTPAGGRVVVRTALAPASGRAVLRVSDDGAGIEAAMLGRLFQPFMQADATLDRSKGGLGLGLALVKGLVELHGGAVGASSAGPGQGAEFVVELPIAAGAVAPRSPRAGRTAETHRRVLIIEDNLDAADSLCEVLRLGGHEVEVAHSGPEGLALARDFQPEVVLCDIGLPGMDGYAVARAWRADDALRGAYLVALSGYALPEDQQRAAEAGFATHLAKPPSLDKLDELLARANLPGAGATS